MEKENAYETYLPVIEWIKLNLMDWKYIAVECPRQEKKNNK